MALADYANDDGICWPSIGRIVKRTKLGTRTVQRTIRKLQVAGLLAVATGGRDSENKRWANTYRLTLGTPATLAPPATVTPLPMTTPPPATVAGDRVPMTPPPPATVADQLSGNPHGERSKSRQGFAPTLHEVRDYGQDHGLTAADAENFFDFYEASGWRQRGGNRITNWRAAARSWARRSRAEKNHDDDLGGTPGLSEVDPLDDEDDRTGAMEQ